MYTEASSGVPGFNTTLMSPLIYANSTSAVCLAFWYHMYGVNCGTLAVERVLPEPMESSETLWSASGNQGYQWTQVKVEIPDDGNDFRVKFVVTRGNGYRGDIAIDDVTVKSGLCFQGNSILCYSRLVLLFSV